MYHNNIDTNYHHHYQHPHPHHQHQNHYQQHYYYHHHPTHHYNQYNNNNNNYGGYMVNNYQPVNNSTTTPVRTIANTIDWLTASNSPPPAPPPSPWSAVLYHPLCLYPSLYSSPNLDQVNTWPTSTAASPPATAPLTPSESQAPPRSPSPSSSSSSDENGGGLPERLSSSSSSSLNINSSSSNTSSSDEEPARSSSSSNNNSDDDDDSLSAFDDDEVAKNVVDSVLSQSAAAAAELSDSSSSTSSISLGMFSSSSSSNAVLAASPSSPINLSKPPKFVAPRFERKWLQFNNNQNFMNQQPTASAFLNFYPSGTGLNHSPVSSSYHKKQTTQQRYQRNSNRGELIDSNNRTIVKNNIGVDTFEQENYNNHNNNRHGQNRRYQYSPMLNHPGTGFYNGNSHTSKPRFYFQRLPTATPTVAASSSLSPSSSSSVNTENQLGSSKAYQNYSYAAVANNAAANSYNKPMTTRNSVMLKMRS